MFRTSTALALALLFVTQQWDPEVVAHPTRKVISGICRIPDTARCPEGDICVSQCEVSARPVGAECQCGKVTGNVVAK